MLRVCVDGGFGSAEGVADVGGDVRGKNLKMLAAFGLVWVPARRPSGDFLDRSFEGLEGETTSVITAKTGEEVS